MLNRESSGSRQPGRWRCRLCGGRCTNGRPARCLRLSGVPQSFIECSGGLWAPHRLVSGVRPAGVGGALAAVGQVVSLHRVFCVHDVVAVLPKHVIVACSAVDDVVAPTAPDSVVAVEAADPVVTAQTADEVGPACAVQYLAAVAAGDGAGVAPPVGIRVAPRAIGAREGDPSGPGKAALAGSATSSSAAARAPWRPSMPPTACRGD
jgi:hypothetical protein